MFLTEIDKLGWGSGGEEVNRAVEESWHAIVAKISSSKYQYCLAIIHDAVRQGKTPQEFGDCELDLWSSKQLGLRRTPPYVRSTVREFRKAIELLELTDQLPGVSPAARRIIYGVPFEQLPPALRNEIAEVLTWKQIPSAPGRSKKKGKHRGKMRPVTANSLREFFCRLYGFRVNAPHKAKDAEHRTNSEPGDHPPRRPRWRN